ncbi:hypothetical protein [Blastococcus sp. PRF04-17]|uniref:hypothetical protein n=1 Tax=Blastococcus sp. PRF04-17 TaxID=2933797 RepID=UPI001FF42EF1|nr:hypothetical protein [Blastococcus sp. PRF04-17]UOY02459.1 hypothetical protein MVA48_03460 [Blastococcus sp. PRF04-17]
MSWERCPSCAASAAVDWKPVMEQGAAAIGEEAAEWAAPSGCTVAMSELAKAVE